MRRLLAVALAAALALGAAPASAQDGEGAVAVVLDRSASLRRSDPARRGPRLLATALALVGDGRPWLLVGAGERPAPLPADAAALAAALAAVADAAPQDGGADLAPLLARAREAAGPSGVVLLLTDDDLDVFGADGAPPEAALERAKKGAPRPARDEVNRAAVELLVEGGAGLPRVVALRAPLPPLARTAPFLAPLGAQTVELEGGDAEVVARLAEAITGAPRVLRRAPASAPAAGRAVVLLEAPGDVPGGAALGGDRRAWLVDLSAGQPLAAQGGAWLVAPRLDPPGEAVAWSLRGGVVRVLARATGRPGPSALAVSDGKGGPFVPLAGEGPWRWADLRGDPAEVEVAATLDDGAGGAVLGERRRVPVGQGEVVLEARGLVRAGEPLELAGHLPRGLPGGPVAIAVREAQGAQTLLSLAPSGPADAQGRVPVAATFVPQTAGEVTVEPRGDLAVRLAAPVSLTAAIRRRLTLVGFAVGGGEVPPGGVVELDEQGGATIALRLTLDPPATAPVPLQVSLEGAPEGATIEVAGVGSAAAAGGVTIVDAATPTLRLTWPAGGGSARCAVRLRGRAGVSLLAGRSISVGAPASWARRLAALGLLAGAAAWAILLLRKRKQTAVLIARTHGHRQLRAVGPNGRITFERYRFQEHASGDDLRVHIQPEDSQASIEICLRDDGTILAVGKDGARIVHEDRPTVLSDEAVLRHGTAFAVVHNKRARRYVYLEHEPSAEELTGRFGDSMTGAGGVSGAGSAMGESGLYVLLDDDQNLAASQDVSATGRIFPTSRRMVGMPESGRAPKRVSDEPAPDADEASAHPVPTPSTAGPVELIEDSKEAVIDPELLEESDDALFDSSGETQVSDEGIVVMDSTEAEILDSQEIDRLEEPRPDSRKTRRKEGE